MNIKISRILLVPTAICLLYPSLAFASWYNPFGWFGSSDTSQSTQQVQTIPQTSNNSSYVWYNPLTWFGSSNGSTNSNGVNNTAAGTRFSEPSKNIIHDSQTGLNWMKCDYGESAISGKCNPVSSSVPNISKSVGMGYTGTITNTNSDSSIFNMCENGVMCSDGSFQVVNWRSDSIAYKNEYPSYIVSTGPGYIPAPQTAKARSCSGHGGVANDSWQVPTFGQLQTLYDQTVGSWNIDQNYFPGSGGNYMTEERHIGPYGSEPNNSDGFSFLNGKTVNLNTGNLKCVSGVDVTNNATGNTDNLQAGLSSAYEGPYCTVPGIKGGFAAIMPPSEEGSHGIESTWCPIDEYHQSPPDGANDHYAVCVRDAEMNSLDVSSQKLFIGSMDNSNLPLDFDYDGFNNKARSFCRSITTGGFRDWRAITDADLKVFDQEILKLNGQALNNNPSSQNKPNSSGSGQDSSTSNLYCITGDGVRHSYDQNQADFESACYKNQSSSKPISNCTSDEPCSSGGVRW